MPNDSESELPTPPTPEAEIARIIAAMQAASEETQAAEYGRNPRRARRGQETPELGVIIEPTANDALSRLVLREETRNDLLAGVSMIERRAELEAVWNISQVQPMQGRCILNFYGPPGTGKTRAARAIALRLNRKVYQVDYSAVISKYLGDTAKHIVAAFARAKELNAVLFFDEADSLMSRRVATGESCSTSINQNRNVLMQELDRFDGVVVMTTNLFGNYDPALLRRVARHIEFALPNRAMRTKLFELHLPNLSRVSADLSVMAEQSKGLSGGDILNVCLNAMFAASASEDSSLWKVTEFHLMAEIEKARAAKRANSGGASATPAPAGGAAN